MAEYTEIASTHIINPPDDGDTYKPSEYEKQLVKDVVDKYRNTADARNQAFNYLDGRNITEYINDSVQRFTTNIDSREGIEDWQARVNDPFTRNKVLAVLGKVVSVLPIANFVARGDEDIRKASILSDLYTYSEQKADYEEFMTHYLLEAIVKGTAVGYEGMEYNERKIREVRGIGDKITVTENTKKETKLFAEIVPLEEFYPSSVGIRTVKEMPYCFWRKEYSYSEFIAQWGYFEKSKLVQASGQNYGEEDRPFYLDYITNETADGNVEVVRYYNVIDDCYVVIANGIWLNPLAKETLSPIPFAHKRLPFFEVKFDFLGNWFYGKSLPDKLQSMQDVLNVLTNMLLDQSFLTIFPPLLTNGFDTIEDDYLRPGRRTPIDTQGLPIAQAFMKLDLGTPQGWHQFILEYTRKVMEESSVDKVSQGIAGTGDRTTAQEIRVAAEGVAAILGLFGRMVNYGLKQKALLRGMNILQFWTDKDKPALTGVLGADGDKMFAKAFNLFKIDNTTLSGGKRGTRVIALYGAAEDRPAPEEVKARSAVAKELNGRNVEYMAVDAEYIRNIEFDVKMVMDQNREETRDVEKALQLEKVRIYMSFFPQQVDVNELAAQTAEKMGDDPSKILKQDIMNPLPPEEGAETQQPMGTQPQGSAARNILQQGRGNDAGLQQMSQLGIQRKFLG